MTSSAPVPSRLKWKCRRGMREMDILMTRFLERGYGELDAAGRRDFERLLDFPDQDLLAWLWGHDGPDDARLGALLSRMREVVHGP